MNALKSLAFAKTIACWSKYRNLGNKKYAAFIRLKLFSVNNFITTRGKNACLEQSWQPNITTQTFVEYQKGINEFLRYKIYEKYKFL